MDFTPIARKLLGGRLARATAWEQPEGLEQTQRRVLRWLLHRARHTVAGQRHGFGYLGTYEEFARRVPATGYEGIRSDVMRMVAGQGDVLWPGKVRRFAQSSGTSGGKSKYIPVTDDELRLNHFAGTRDTVARYLQLYPDSRLFSGRALILGGSFANSLDNPAPGVKVGDLSANLIDAIPLAGEIFRVPSRKTALMADWESKLPAIATESMRHNITNLSGVPSWFLTVLRKVLELAGTDSIHDVWPNLEVFFHGGIAFGPYREQYRAITDASRMRYLETYNASEGFFAVADTIGGSGMLLLADNGVFYEFAPADADPADPHPQALPAWAVRPGEVYSLLISSCNGLWRYAIGDTVRIESVAPLRVSIAGRTRCFINAFGEELMVYNAEEAVAAACAATGAEVSDYTAAPVYATSGSRGRHQWLLEWVREPQGGAEAFAAALDKALRAANSDYQAKRQGGIFLDPPQITAVAPGTFALWLAETGRLGGQRKVPRLANDRHIADRLLEISNDQSPEGVRQ